VASIYKRGARQAELWFSLISLKQYVLWKVLWK